MIIFVRGIEREVVFTFEIFHDSISIMSEDLGFTEEDEVSLVDLYKILEVEDISGQILDIPCHSSG